MKKLYKFLLISVLSSITLFYSCDTVELEILTSPNALSVDQADPDLLLNSMQLSYRGSQRTFQANSAELGRISYMFGRNYLENYGPGTLTNSWNSYYSNNLTNLESIIALNANPDKDLSYHIGMGKTMQAHTLMQLVDFLGDVPFSEAGNPDEFPKPKVDDDEIVYAAAIAMLAEAKTLFQGTTGIGTGTDLFYDGDASKWIKLVNTLQMRANLTTKNYAAVVSATNLIASADDDFQFNYGDNVLSPDTRHPNYASDYTSSGANIYQSNWLISTMVGQYGDLSASTDPRRRYYFYRQNWRTPGSYALYEDVNGAFGPAGSIYISNGAGDGETLSCSLQDTPTHLQFTPDEEIWCSMPLGYWGRFHGNDEGTPPDNFTRTAVGVYPSGGSFDGRADAFPYVGDSPTATFGQAVGLGNGGAGAGMDPIYLSSYVDFMKAEANLALGNTAAAATHLEDGMTKSIAKVQSFGALDASADFSQAPSAATVTDFIDAKVAEFNAAAASTSLDASGFPTAKDKLDILGEQYFVAIYGGAGDAFNFIRRTGYPRTISRSIDGNADAFPRTVLYPGSEVSSNSNILQKTDLSTTVFWDAGIVNPAN
ncbi:MAG: hypothetical protein ACJAT9_000693 [Polaribacter sp.]|jgi:hypothetical protein|tara:strand:+ start:2101 stop:3891 length:1791 start_codon:yes stop_codon:yes gene_type:complete